jgi:hypothetical protein
MNGERRNYKSKSPGGPLRIEAKNIANFQSIGLENYELLSK